jgi:hypothetical protein
MAYGILAANVAEMGAPAAACRPAGLLARASCDEDWNFVSGRTRSSSCYRHKPLGRTQWAREQQTLRGNDVEFDGSRLDRGEVLSAGCDRVVAALHSALVEGRLGLGWDLQSRFGAKSVSESGVFLGACTLQMDERSRL